MRKHIKVYFSKLYSLKCTQFMHLLCFVSLLLVDLIFLTFWIVSVLHQDEGNIGKSISDISRGQSPREIMRFEGNPNTSRVLGEYLPSFRGVHQFFKGSGSGNPSLWGKIDSVKINPSLMMMMRECLISEAA